MLGRNTQSARERASGFRTVSNDNPSRTIYSASTTIYLPSMFSLDWMKVCKENVLERLYHVPYVLILSIIYFQELSIASFHSHFGGIWIMQNWSISGRKLIFKWLQLTQYTIYKQVLNCNFIKSCQPRSCWLISFNDAASGIINQRRFSTVMQWQRKSGRYTTTISLTPRLTPGAMYAFRVQFVKSGITSSVHNDLSLMKRPSE